MDASAEIRWEFDQPRPGFSRVTGLTEEARGFLHWMATDGEAPVEGVWDGMSLVIETEVEGDYLNTVLTHNGFIFDDEESMTA